MKQWFYIASWKRTSVTWGDSGTKWQRVGAIGPMLMTEWEMSVWRDTERVKHNADLVQVWRWDGQWILLK